MDRDINRFSLARCTKQFGLVLLFSAWAAGVSADGLEVDHRIEIELVPVAKKIIGADSMVVKPSGNETLDYRLSERASILSVTVNAAPRKYRFDEGHLRLNLGADAKSPEVRVDVRYAAVFDDPVPDRPVNTDNPGFGVTATISEAGSFLLSGAGWYPELANSRATYRLEVSAPDGIIAVTAGRSLGHFTANGKTTSAWAVTYPVEGLSLSAARYVVDEKPVGEVTAATYLLPPNRHLAPSYLEATAGYLKLYSELFGPYPFQKFAVVENFFPTGFGFPSYTLMGSTVLRLPFIVHTSLGHEIAHCWWGNGVYVDYRRGNWCEGLTTYVADYLFQEMRSKENALELRRQWLRNFSTLVQPEKDFALSQFQSRNDPVSKTVGYDKGAMIFHMIRQILGDDAFWGTLRDVYRQRLFQPTSWSDLQAAFEKRGRHSLQDFFEQWVYHSGAPRFFLDAVRLQSDGSQWKVTGRIVQNEPYFRFPLTLDLEAGKHRIDRRIEVAGHATAFEITAGERPQKLIADPDYDILRRLYSAEIPPAVNALKGAPSVLIVLPDPANLELKQAAATLAVSLGLANYEFVAEREVDRKQLPEKDVLVIGHPRTEDLLQKMPPEVTIQSTSFSLNAVLYDRPEDVFFGVFHHPHSENRIVALFLPLSSRDADGVAAKITHYGKYSYLAFRGGQNLAKGVWPVENSPLVHRWQQSH